MWTGDPGTIEEQRIIHKAYDQLFITNGYITNMRRNHESRPIERET